MKNISILLLSILLVFSSCNKNKHQISVSYTNMEGEVPSLGNFLITFNEALAPDSLLYTWQDEEYLDFSPKIEGKYKWVSSNELSFSPSTALLPASSYEASFNSALLKINPEFKSIESVDFNFYTAKLNLEYADLYWKLEEDQTTAVHLDLQFNYRVNPADIAKALSVKLSGKDTKIELLTTNEDYSCSFILPEIKASEDDLDIELNLKKGLKPINGNNSTEEDIVLSKQLLSPYKIEIGEVLTDHDGVNGSITIKTSQEINSQDVKKFISLSPQINFKIEITSSELILKSIEFDVNTKYKLSLKKGLLGLVGGKLQADYQSELTFGELEPSIQFENTKGMYLNAAGKKNLAIRIVNIKEVKISVYKLYESNVLMTNLGSNYYYDDYYDDDYYYDDYYASDLQEQDLIFEKVIKTESLKKTGFASLLNMDFKDVLKDYKGIYFVKVQSTEDYWLNDAKYLSISDIGLITKVGQNKVFVLANSIASAEALAGVNVKVYGRNNQLISSGTTNTDGSLSLALKNTNFTGFKPALISAEKNGDFTVLNLQDTRVETSRFDVGGYRDLPNGLQSFIYLERNLYRPGEEVHYAAIIRNQTWISPGKLPIRVEVINPSGKSLGSFKKTLNEEGSLSGEFTVSEVAQTGSYTIYLYTSNDVLLASKNVMVEEFMPDRIKFSANLTKEQLTPKSDKCELQIFAQNLFGPPAANRNYEMEISFRKMYFSPKDFSDYNFHISNTENYFSTDVRQGKTDEAGKAVEAIVMPESFKNMGAIQADIITTVFDETGRPVNRKSSLEMYTQESFYGLGSFPYYLATNTLLNIPLVAVDKDGKAKSGVKALVQVIKHEYQTVLNKSGSFYRYESNKVEKLISKQELTLNGKSSFNFTPMVSGQYEIRVYNPEVNGTYVSSSFYAYGYGRTYLSSFEVDNEGRIEIESDKESYELGDDAKILFKTPFQGKMLVTIESGEVLEYFIVNTDKRSAELSFELKKEYIPNVYISATLIKPHVESEFPLTVAHGFQSISISESKREMAISINATASSRSNTKQKIKVKAAPNSLVSLAIVDEGILQVGGFITPRPYDYFYQKRALMVNSFDLYPFLLPEISSSNSSGGDEGFDMSKRVNPFQNKRVKLVSYWSGLLQTNSSGEASYEIDIPQFSGSLRIMAVGHKGNSFGTAESNMTVADPIVISTAIPRFLSPGDTAYLSTTLSNTTEKSASAKASISVSGALKVIGVSKENLSVKAKSEERVVFKVYASNDIGVGKITISCDAFNENFKEITDISVRPAVPLLKQNGSGTILASSSSKLNIQQNNLIENSSSYKLVISKNPMIEFAKDLDYLVKYPYGCSEQTISTAFPQLYYDELIKSMYNKTDKSMNINQNIMVAINKLKMRQLYNGSIAMWDNCNCESWWVSAYAAHFLLEAKKAGFTVDEEFLESVLSYLKNRLKSKETVSYYYARNLSKKIAPKEVAYSLYVLALANKADLSLMNYYKSNTEILALDSRYLLAAAYVLAGDKDKAKVLLPNNFSSEESVKQFGGSFYSPIRDEAIALNALIEIDPNHKEIGVMAKHISQYLKSNTYMNTQERIFSILALGKLSKLANASDLSASVLIDGKNVATYESGVMSFGTADLKNKQVEIKVSGKGKLYYFWESEGISKDGSFKEEDSYLMVRKTFYDRYGNPITNKRFKQNDLIVVKLSIKASYNGTINNVVITDMLPAGFEIENPRIDDVPGTQWIKNKSYPDYLDIRDDRINIFDDVYAVGGNTQDYYYVVRAVSPGVYKMGPVGADAMYNGEYHSYNGGGYIKIAE